MNKKILVLYQDWDRWFLDKDKYKKFEHRSIVKNIIF